MRKKTLLGLLILTSVFLSACTSNVIKTTNTEPAKFSVDKIYDLDPQRDFIGQKIGDSHFVNIITGSQVHLDEIYKDKVLMIQSFSNGCPACVRGIVEYNEFYEEYDIEIIYMDINPGDTVETIIATKEDFNGKDWVWANYQGSLLPFYEEFNFVVNDMTIIVDKSGTIVYADSFSVPKERLENELNKLGVKL